MSPGLRFRLTGQLCVGVTLAASRLGTIYPFGLRARHTTCTVPRMLNLLSLIVGAIALVLGILAFFPLLGWGYWLIIPFALLGLGLGVVSNKTSGRNLNLVVIVIGVIRLIMGGGII